MRSAKRDVAESLTEASLSASLASDDEQESRAERRGGGPEGIQPEVDGWGGGSP